MTALKVLSIFLSIYNVGNGASILAIIPTASFSHQVAFVELWRELSLRGHNVTLVTTDPTNDVTLKNLKEINMTRSYKTWQKPMKMHESLSIWNVYEFLYFASKEVLEHQLSQPELQEFIAENKKFKFDLVMIEIFYPELLALVKIYNCPAIMMATIGSTTIQISYNVNLVHPILHPDINLDYFGILNFEERVISTLYQWYLMYTEYVRIYPIRQRIVDRYFSNVTGRRIEDLLSEIALVFVNENPLFKGSRVFGPSIVTVSGGNHIKPIKLLPQVNSSK